MTVYVFVNAGISCEYSCMYIYIYIYIYDIWHYFNPIVLKSCQVHDITRIRH